ncbi:MAG: ABC transporter substrate-binding protein [Sciscionella sp.]
MLAVTAVTITACSSRTASSPATDKGPITLGVLVGSVAEGGPDFVNGMKVAITNINASGGVAGRKLTLQTFQTGSTTAGAVSAYRSAAQSDVVGAFFGAVTGALAVKAQSDSIRLPIVIATASDAVDHPAAKYVFHNSFAGEYATSSLTYAVKHDGVKRVAEIHYDTDYSVGIQDALTKRCAELGCQVVDNETASSTASVDALIPQLTKMRNANPDAYFIEGLNPSSFAAARQLGITQPIISDQWLAIPALRDACGKNCDGVVFAIHKANVPQIMLPGDPLRQTLISYRDSYIQQIGSWAGFSIYGNDAVEAFAQAARDLITAGKTPTRDNIAMALASFHGNLTTTHGVINTSPSNHRLVGTWNESYVDVAVKVSGTTASWVLAPGADPAGSTP